MIPLFKSHYSIGKSILTLSPPTLNSRVGSSSSDHDTKERLENGPASIVAIVQRHEINPLVLVEDSLIGFLEAKKAADELGVQLVFGLRVDLCSDMKTKITRNSEECVHKVIIFAKNTEGCKLLNKIYTSAFTVGSGKIDPPTLQTFYNKDLLHICVPFYDSFLFHNLFSYRKPCILDHSFFEPTFFLENNLLPFDEVLRSVVEEYAHESGLQTEEVKSIYYEKRSDFEAYQTYKCICGRGFSSRALTLDKPNLDHCGSPEFCLESYLEHESS